MESVVGHRFRRRLLHPRVEGGAQPLSFVLDGKVDQRCGAAESGGAGAGLKVVGAGGAPERHIQMGVDIDSAGEYVFVRGIDQAFGIFARQASTQGNHAVACNGDIGQIGVGCGNHRAVCNDSVEPHWPIPSAARAPLFGRKRDVFYSTKPRLCLALGAATGDA